MFDPYQVVRDFEAAICEYTGAPYCVAVNSCTMALLLACENVRVEEVTIPSRTYVSVPQSIIHAGGWVKFEDYTWQGIYRLAPYGIWDSARRFTSNMYQSKEIMCVSFHASKILGIEQGGAILHDSPIADEWYRRARFDGRTEGVAPKDDKFILGHHCYMSPSVAALGLLKLYSLPKDNADLPNDDYPDLSKIKIFKNSGRRPGTYWIDKVAREGTVTTSGGDCSLARAYPLPNDKGR